jgi:hypothetical protein
MNRTELVLQPQKYSRKTGGVCCNSNAVLMPARSSAAKDELMTAQ